MSEITTHKTSTVAASAQAAAEQVDLKSYALVTAAYWGFTLTDGALRMLVLLYFYELGYNALEVALLFILYEIAGVITNLIGGWLGSRFGLKLTLFRAFLLPVRIATHLKRAPSAFGDTTSLIALLELILIRSLATPERACEAIT